MSTLALAHNFALDRESVPTPASEGARPLRFITCGSVDDGKSTLIGRLLWDTKVVMDDQRAALLASRSSQQSDLALPDFSMLLDGLQAEREQGITIDVAYRYFSAEGRSFIVADTPGHEQYTGNMVTGASTADLAVILVDARAGILEQTRRHITITTMMGIEQLVLVINKMDLAQYSRARYQEIAREFSEFAKALGVKSTIHIPASAIKGENLTISGTASMPWYQGPTLLEALVQAECGADRNKAFRMPVQRISRPDESFRGYQGSVTGGTASVGDTIVVLPSLQEARIERIVRFESDEDTAASGDAVTLVLDRKVDISRGDMIAAVGEPPMTGQSFAAKLIVLSADGLSPGKRYWLKSEGRRQRVSVEAGELLDLKTLAWKSGADLKHNSISSVRLRFEEKAIFDLYADNRRTGSFILIDPDTHGTVAGGMIVAEGGEPERRESPADEEIITLSLPARLAKAVLRSELLAANLNEVQIARVSRLSPDGLLKD